MLVSGDFVYFAVCHGADANMDAKRAPELHLAPSLTPPPMPDVLGPHHARAELAYGTV